MSCSRLHTKKKTLIAIEQKREDVALARTEWRQNQAQIAPERLVFIDETWAKTNMTRTWGRSQSGTRVVEHVPFGRWETTTFLGALRATGFVAPLTVDGPINGSIFRAWVEQHLAPTLSQGDVVIMDNLSSHKVSGVREAIEAAGAQLRYLPPYSPDLNPIELAFSNSRSSSATVPNEPSTNSGNSAEPSSTCSQTQNAEIISNIVDIDTLNRQPL